MIKLISTLCSILIMITGICQELITESEFLNKASVEDIVQNNFKNQAGYLNYQSIKIDLGILTKEGKIEVNCKGSKFTVDKFKHFDRGQKDYSWYGKDSTSSNNILITVLDETIIGIINIGDKLFRIETISGEQVLIEIDQVELNKATCGAVDDEHAGTSVNDQWSKWTNENLIPLNQKADFNCNIRVLVIYTFNASQIGGDMKAVAQMSIDQMNATFWNSNVQASVELAYAQEIFYNETSVSVTSSGSTDDDLNRFRIDGDGYMDAVHLMKREHSADICVLLCDIPSSLNYAGVARSIKSSESNAFCLVDYWYAYSNLTFAHEIGHLIGCRHNQSSDPSVAPYPYGHGYVHPSQSWRTIMSTIASCNDCPRLWLWSNPDVYYSGDVTGNSGTADNASVIDENFQNVLSLRSNIYQNYILQYEVFAAPNSILYNANNLITVQSVVVYNSLESSFFAGDYIELNPGFEAQSGSNFTAKIVASCGAPDGLQSDYDFNPDLVDYPYNSDFINDINDTGLFTKAELYIYPNPSHDQCAISFFLAADNQVEIMLTSSNGHEIKNLWNGQKMSGRHNISLETNNLDSGIYFIILSVLDGQSIVRKLIIQ